jgi:orotidine-5'-phosphate decarboxylase
MNNFKERIKKLATEKSPLILANDYETQNSIESKTLANIKNLNQYLCALKFNFHFLLPLGEKQIKKINKTAHDSHLQTIADIKLNDIGNTNLVAVQILWDLGFDAVIVNPMMGPSSLENLIKLSHKNKRGIISLCHMSTPEAKITYELGVNFNSTKTSLYKLFLDWAIKFQSDGIIVGATYPQTIKFAKKQSKGKLDIYSPGIGTQGGDVQKTLSSGSDYLIVGRTILNAKNPTQTTKSMFNLAKN